MQHKAHLLKRWDREATEPSSVKVQPTGTRRVQKAHPHITSTSFSHSSQKRKHYIYIYIYVFLVFMSKILISSRPRHCSVIQQKLHSCLTGRNNQTSVCMQIRPSKQCGQLAFSMVFHQFLFDLAVSEAGSLGLATWFPRALFHI